MWMTNDKRQIALTLETHNFSPSQEHNIHIGLASCELVEAEGLIPREVEHCEKAWLWEQACQVEKSRRQVLRNRKGTMGRGAALCALTPRGREWGRSPKMSSVWAQDQVKEAHPSGCLLHGFTWFTFHDVLTFWMIRIKFKWNNTSEVLD